MSKYAFAFNTTLCIVNLFMFAIVGNYFSLFVAALCAASAGLAYEVSREQ